MTWGSRAPIIVLGTGSPHTAIVPGTGRPPPPHWMTPPPAPPPLCSPQALVDKTQEFCEGTVRVKLYKGNVVVGGVCVCGGGTVRVKSYTRGMWWQVGCVCVEGGLSASSYTRGMW